MTPAVVFRANALPKATVDVISVIIWTR